MRENICLILKIIGLIFGAIYINTWDKTFGWLWIGFWGAGLTFGDIWNWIKERKGNKNE